jgi:hypothetical protein
MRREDPTENLSRDMAQKIASHLGSRNNLFSFSSVNRKLRSFFQSEREDVIKMVKIIVRKNVASSFLHCFDGKLFACGHLSRGISGINKWTRIGPLDQAISELVINNHDITLNIFVRCKEEWYQSGEDIFEWALIQGPEDQKILELIPLKDSSAYIRCPDNVWYFANWNQGKLLDWKILELPSKTIFEIVLCSGRTFVSCEEGWYACGRNAHGELGTGDTRDQKDWIKLGPPDKTVLKLKANESNTLIYCNDGRWYGCGQNNSGQLGTGNRENQLSWIALGQELNEIESVFLETNSIFITCSDGLYAAGEVFPDHFENLKNWKKIGVSTQEILEIFGAKNTLFIRYSDGWYYLTEDNRTGLFGLSLSEHASGGWGWKKLTCEGKEILQLIPSQDYAFAACADGWYFAGSNSFGVNGMNDDDHFTRTRWIKMFSHGEDIETAVVLATIKKEYIQGIPTPVRFRMALKKLYEPDTLLWLQNTLREFGVPHLRICYHENYPGKQRFYFFFPHGSREISSNFEGHLEDRICEILDYPYLRILNNYEFTNPLYFQVRVFTFPSPSLSASLFSENNDELLSFLRSYEAILDIEADNKSDLTLGFGT